MATISKANGSGKSPQDERAKKLYREFGQRLDLLAEPAGGARLDGFRTRLAFWSGETDRTADKIREAVSIKEADTVASDFLERLDYYVADERRAAVTVKPRPPAVASAIVPHRLRQANIEAERRRILKRHPNLEFINLGMAFLNDGYRAMPPEPGQYEPRPEETARHAKLWEIYVAENPDHGNLSDPWIAFLRKHEAAKADPPKSRFEFDDVHNDPPETSGRKDDEDDEGPKFWIAPHDFWADLATEKIREGMVPPVIWNTASEYSLRTGHDLDTLITTMLTAVSSAVSPNILVSAYDQEDIRFKQPLYVWQGNVGPSGTNKTGVQNDVFVGLEEIEESFAKTFKQEEAEFYTRSKQEQRDSDPPVRHRLFLSKNYSQEGAEIEFSQNEHLTNKQDELITFFSQMGRYSNRDGSGEQSARGFWLSVYDLQRFTLTRASRKSIDCVPAGVVIGGIQNEVVRKLAGENSRADGLIQRFQWVMMPKFAAQPVKIDKPRYPMSAFYQLTKDVYSRMPLRLTGGTFHFSQKAEPIRDKLFEWVAEKVKHHSAKNAVLASHISKYKGLFLRYCGIFHIIQHYEDKMPRLISAETASMVYKFLTSNRYSHAQAFYHLLRANAENDDMKNIAEYILSHDLKRVSAREVQNGSARFDKLTARDIANTCSTMVALGWLHVIAGKRVDSFNWRVNPDVHILFEGRAGIVKKRNADAVISIEQAKANALARADAAKRAAEANDYQDE